MKTKNVNLISPEDVDSGDIKWQDYKDFFAYSYGTCGIALFFVLCVMTSIAQLLPSLWLTKWLDEDLEGQQDSNYPTIFAVLIVIFIILTMLRSLGVFKLILTSTTNLHDTIVQRVLRADILFFDSNPIGRIVTRFSKDLIVFDLLAPIISIITIQGFFRTVTVVIIISIINYWMIPVVAVCAVLMYLIFTKGTKVMIEAQRRDSESRGPIHGTFAMAINGLVSLRVAEKLQFFRQDFINSLSYGTNATFCYVIANRWIGIRMDILCCLFNFCIALFLILLKGKVDNTLLVMSL